MTPLVSDPDVQNALTNRLTATVFQYVDVEGIADDAVDALAAQGLPPQVADRLSTLTPTLASAVTGFVRDKIAELVASPAFASAWNQAIQVAHRQMVTLLSGESEGDRGPRRHGLPRTRPVRRPGQGAAERGRAHRRQPGARRQPDGGAGEGRHPGARPVRLQHAGHGGRRAALGRPAPAGRGGVPGPEPVPGAGRDRARDRPGHGGAGRGPARRAGPAGRCRSGAERPRRRRRGSTSSWPTSGSACGPCSSWAWCSPSPGSSPAARRAPCGSGARWPVGCTGSAAARPRPAGSAPSCGHTSGDCGSARWPSPSSTFVFLEQPTGAAILLIAALLLVVLAVIEFLGRPGDPPPAEPEVVTDAAQPQVVSDGAVPGPRAAETPVPEARRG